mgnify:CR=1 FL=1
MAYQPQPMLESEARMWAMLLNLATVLGFVLSGGTLTIVAVLVIWLIFRERSALVDFHGKQQMNIALTILVTGIAGFVLGILTLGIGFFVFIPAWIIYSIYVFVMAIVGAVAANRGEYYVIPGVFRFIK